MRGVDGYYLANRQVSVEDITEAFDQMMAWTPKLRRQQRDSARESDKPRKHRR